MISSLKTRASIAGLALAFFFLVACPNKPETKSPSEVANPVERGKNIYVANCTACHAVDPKKDGSLGPAIWGSSRELVEARVLHAAYPEGYKPKRPSKIMVALPHLKNDIESIAAYLNAN